MSWTDEIEELRRREELAAADGRRREGRAPARVRQADRARARSRAIVDAGSFHEIGTLAGVGEYDEDGNLRDSRPSNFVFGTADDRRPPGRWSRATTSPCAAARPTRRSPASASSAEGLALELGLPHVRLVDGMGGGGSVKTIEMAGRTYIPEVRGWEIVVAHIWRWRRRCRSRWARWPASAPRASPPVALLGDRARHRADDDRRPRAGRVTPAAATSRRKSSVTRASTPPTARSTTRSTPRSEAFGAPRDSSRTCRRTSTSCRRARLRTDDPSAPRRVPARVVPRDPRKAYKMREVIGSVVDAGRSSRSAATGAARSSPASRASTAGRSPSSPRTVNVYGGGVDRRRVPQADALHRPGVDLPPAAAAPRGLPGLPDRQAVGAGVDHPLRLADAGRARPGAGAVLLRWSAQGVRRRRRRESQARRHSFRFAWPSGDWGSLPIEGGIEVAYKAELAESADYARISRRSSSGSIACARRSARPSTSRSKRSSTRATRVRCCAGGCGSRANNCGGRERFRSAIDHDAASNTDRAVALLRRVCSRLQCARRPRVPQRGDLHRRRGAAIRTGACGDPRWRDHLCRRRRPTRPLDRPLDGTGGRKGGFGDAWARRRPHASAAGGYAVAEVRARLRFVDRRRNAGPRAQMPRRLGGEGARRLARSGSTGVRRACALPASRRPRHARRPRDKATDHRPLVIRAYRARKFARARTRGHRRDDARSGRRQDLARRRRAIRRDCSRTPRSRCSIRCCRNRPPPTTWPRRAQRWTPCGARASRRSSTPSHRRRISRVYGGACDRRADRACTLRAAHRTHSGQRPVGRRRHGRRTGQTIRQRGIDGGARGITVRNAKLFLDGVIAAPALTGAMLEPYRTNAGTVERPKRGFRGK